MKVGLWELLFAIALQVFASAMWDGIKSLARIAWPRRQLVVAGVRRVVLPSPDLQLQLVVTALVVSLVFATLANELPPAVLRN
jgi:hypothetical protein